MDWLRAPESKGKLMIQHYYVPREEERVMVSDLRAEWDRMSEAKRQGIGQFGLYVLACMIGGHENMKRWLEGVKC